MTHALMRGLKDAPFMLMEQTPSQQNWQPYNSLKRPGQMRAQSYQTMAHGADTIQFFQLRRSVGGCEKFHGAVIAHAGTENTRVFREVKQLGEELERLSDLIPGSVNGLWNTQAARRSVSNMWTRSTAITVISMKKILAPV